jgi:pimeloyl-ACP methyl ester carboxylesterase
LLDYLGIAQAIVGGASMGGYVAFALLRHHPERFKGLLLLGTRAGADNEQNKELRYKMIDQARTAGPAALADMLLPWMVSESTRQEQPDLVMFVRDMMASTPVEGIVGALEAMATRPDSTPLLAGITVPTFIIAGSDDRVAPVSVAEEMQQAIPHAQLNIVQGTSQALNLERTADVNQMITLWASQFN